MRSATPVVGDRPAYRVREGGPEVGEVEVRITRMTPIRTTFDVTRLQRGVTGRSHAMRPASTLG